MNIEDQHTNGDQGNDEPQLPAPQESVPSAGGQDNQVQPSMPGRSSHPEGNTKKINAARVLRNFIGEGLGLPGWSKVEKKIEQLENIIGKFLDEEGKSKG